MLPFLSVVVPVYNEEASERHWREMLALFGEALKVA